MISNVLAVLQCVFFYCLPFLSLKASFHQIKNIYSIRILVLATLYYHVSYMFSAVNIDLIKNSRPVIDKGMLLF